METTSSKSNLLQKKRKKKKQIKKRSKIRMLCSYAYVGFLLLFISLSVIGKFNLMPTNSWLQMRTVISGSMEPTIPIGSLIVTKKTPEEKLKVDDVISFESNGETVTHRIALIDEEGKIQTKGDANPTFDEGHATNIIGKVLFHLPKIGFFFQILQTTRGTTALVLTIITLLLLDQFIRLLWRSH